MFSIKRKFLNSDGDICLNKALMGKRFAPVQPLLFMKMTFNRDKFSDELRQSILTALESFTILDFKFETLETGNVQFEVELETSHQPNTVLAVIELVFEKNRQSANIRALRDRAARRSGADRCIRKTLSEASAGGEVLR
jgi:hypothetical protein